MYVHGVFDPYCLEEADRQFGSCAELFPSSAFSTVVHSS